MKIESRDQSVKNLLASLYFRIPRFQRPYSWDHENVQDFWNDVVQDNPGDYFIGSMVIYQADKEHFGIVDGQQRLTTITILLCVLRDAYNKLGFKNLATGVHALIERKNIDNKKKFVLTTETSYPFFQDTIQSWGKPKLQTESFKEEMNLRDAYGQLQSLVEGVISSVREDASLSKKKKNEEIKKRLTNIRDSLLGLKLISVLLDNEDDAYIIFETLNTRGKDLSIADLVKNHLTKSLKSTNVSVDQTKIQWQEVLETIEGSSIDLSTDTFIHHFWLSRYDYSSMKKLFKNIKQRIKKSVAKRFLDDLANDAKLYRVAHETSYRSWGKQESRIREALEAFIIFRVKQQIPCVLSLLRKYENKKIRKKHLEESLVAIEKFHFLFTAVTSQRSSGGISAMYASLGREIFEAKDTHAAVEVIRTLKKKLKSRIPSRKEFRALFPEIIYTNNRTKQRALVKYILVELDKQNVSASAIDYKNMTIEHLVPQSRIGSPGFPDNIVGQLGNLILVPEHLNQELSEKTFLEKKKILLKNKCRLPEEIRKEKSWTPELIEQRTTLLSEKAHSKTWKI